MFTLWGDGGVGEEIWNVLAKTRKPISTAWINRHKYISYQPFKRYIVFMIKGSHAVPEIAVNLSHPYTYSLQQFEKTNVAK